MIQFIDFGIEKKLVSGSSFSTEINKDVFKTVLDSGVKQVLVNTSVTGES